MRLSIFLTAEKVPDTFSLLTPFPSADTFSLG